MASRQIVTQLVVAPRADAGSFVRRDIEGVPSIDRAAEFASVVKRKG
jgi:hypothetical protein